MALPTLHSRIKTSFLCLAVTDALGAALEFKPRRSDPSTHVTTMLANTTFDLPPGHFTDDTSMALCLASSLIESNGQTEVLSQATAYVKWFEDGWMSSVPGSCFDVGNQTADTLGIWFKTVTKNHSQVDSTMQLIRKKFSEERQCGNGSLMRVLPCALVAETEEQAVKLARESSEVTHPHQRCLDACMIYTSLVFEALHDASKEDLIRRLQKWLSDTSSVKIDTVLNDRLSPYVSIQSFEDKPEGKISSSGYVVDTLEAALWAFFTTSSYRDGAIKVVNLGDDADTVGAVYGGLAGAFYGIEEVIPSEWINAMKELPMVRDMSDRVIHNFHRTMDL